MAHSMIRSITAVTWSNQKGRFTHALEGGGWPTERWHGAQVQCSKSGIVCLSASCAGKGAAETVRAAAPQTHETHTHELRREGKHMVLRRIRIDCGLAHH